MTDTFTWPVHATASGGSEFTVAQAKFGDNYGQMVPLGLNPEVQKWNVTAEGYRTKADAIAAFVRDHVGVSFFWTPPLGVEGLYVCTRMQPRLDGSLWIINMDFEQAFRP